jgi:hypothetical protein
LRRRTFSVDLLEMLLQQDHTIGGAEVGRVATAVVDR